MRACTHGGGAMSQHNILTRKNCHKFLLCSGWDSNPWSWNPLDLEADALLIEPPRPPDRCIEICLKISLYCLCGWAGRSEALKLFINHNVTPEGRTEFFDGPPPCLESQGFQFDPMAEA